MERNKTLNGFTLAEILVVLFIISFLSALTFANYRQGGKEMALQRAASKLAQDIRRAQEMAIAATESPQGPVCAGQISEGGYGIVLKDSPPPWDKSYVLFADCDADGEYDGDELIERIYFEGGVRLGGLVGPGTSLVIIFQPPDPTLRVNKPPHVTNFPITLQIDNQTTTVTVNRIGLVEIQ